MSSYSNSATLELPKSLSHLHPTFNVSLFLPYTEHYPSLGQSAHPHPLPVYSDATGQYYLFEHIVAETRRGTEPIYVLKWVCYQHSQNTEATHTFLEQEPGCRTAIKAGSLASLPSQHLPSRTAPRNICITALRPPLPLSSQFQLLSLRALP
eukprot:2054946-Rhodomonas_salina.1